MADSQPKARVYQNTFQKSTMRPWFLQEKGRFVRLL